MTEVYLLTLSDIVSRGESLGIKMLFLPQRSRDNLKHLHAATDRNPCLTGRKKFYDGQYCTVKPRYKDTQYKDIFDIRIHLLAPQGLILLCATPRYKDTSVYP
jgi:hypothetical protein